MGGIFIVFNHDDKLALKWEFEYPNYAELVFGISARQQPTKRLRAGLYKPVFDKLTQLFPEISAQNDKEGWWPWWSYADTLDIAVNWLAEPEAQALLLDRSEGSFAHKVIRRALAIQKIRHLFCFVNVQPAITRGFPPSTIIPGWRHPSYIVISDRPDGHIWDCDHPQPM